MANVQVDQDDEPHSRNLNLASTDEHAEHSTTDGDQVNETAVDKSSRLRALNAEVRDQDDLERDIGREADRLLLEQARERDKNRLEKSKALKTKLEGQIKVLRERSSQPIGLTQRAKCKADIDRLLAQVEETDVDISEIEERMNQRLQQSEQLDASAPSTSGRAPNESQRDFLIRTGKITPFSKFGLSSHGEASTDLRGALLDAEEEPDNDEFTHYDAGEHLVSHRNLRQPGFTRSEAVDSSATEEFDSDRPRKRRKLPKPDMLEPTDHDALDSSDAAESAWAQASDGETTDDAHLETDESESGFMVNTETRRKRSKKRDNRLPDEEEVEDLRDVDDGNEALYQSRLRKWTARRSRARARVNRKRAKSEEANAVDDAGESDADDHSAGIESYLRHPELPDTEFNNGYKIPGDIYPLLFDYQKTGVQWLWELYQQQVGGIIGDEMGLGKTVQIIAFLAGLHYSKKLTGPIIVVCPATVMKQWVNEFHRWWPPFRVTILHSSGSGMINLRSETSKEEDLLAQMWDPSQRYQPLTASQKQARKVLRPILDHGGVLVTTYSGLQSYAPLLIPVDWQYAILDEGHKIRNPNTAITIYCKELRTPNRIILSGTPMQNNLIELWSLFDFVFPMRLGTLVNFRNQFEIPIRQGGYANASNLQVQTAFKCAEMLKDAISPYLLQRFKIDVAADLPRKSEQVLFCQLTKLQREAYELFLSSNDFDAIMSGKRQVLYGVDILRKICNHPDLVDHKHLAVKASYDYGNPTKSGKMKVVGGLLEWWKETGHKTLLFAQHRIMLDILEKYIRSMQGMKYRRMDGNTPIQHRQSMVDEFNTDPNIHVFLLTTKVGGLGINLTGADRVIIFDPDWNPSTDQQARERAWRLGQKREVEIYRLMTAGTIEEKIYHRQIFKQFLTNKILKDPKQRQTFHLSDLHDLFSLGTADAPTQTSTMFQAAQVKYSDDKSKPSPQRNGTRDSNEVASQPEKALRKVTGIASVERYAGEVAEEATAIKSSSDGAPTKNSESRVMEGIFARSGIHSAVEHEQIIGGNGKKAVVADPVMIEQEAKKVAAEAARELRKAAEVAKTVAVGTPTWTGTFGVSGRPQETTPQRAFGGASRNRGAGVSSTSLLAGLQQRQGQGRGPSGASTPGTSTPSPSRAGTPTTTGAQPRGKDFGKLIRDYLLNHGGSVYTQMLIDHFNRYCTSPQATMEFKETLKAIATLEKGSSSARGKWKLKREYVGER
jgi:DNA excision repair protein ERCC-6